MDVSLTSTPRLEYEEVPWDVHPTTGSPRQDRIDFGRPYRASIPASIRDLDLRLSGSVAAEAEEAATEIAGFDYSIGMPHKSDHGAVGGFARIYIQEPYAFDGFNGCSNPSDNSHITAF